MKVRKLQEELQQTRPFRSPRHEAMLSVMKTADVVRRRIAGLLDSYDVTMQQYNVMRILRGAGPKGIPTLSIAERLIEETPGITRLLDRMEKRGWVERIRCDRDRRVVYAVITTEGMRLLADIDGPITEFEAEALPHLSEAEVETLIELLARVRADKDEEDSSRDSAN